MTELYEYVRVCSGITAAHMWRDLERSRRLGIKWAGVPATKAEFDAGLEQLERDGLARKADGGVWYWLPKIRPPVAEAKEAMLF